MATELELLNQELSRTDAPVARATTEQELTPEIRQASPVVNTARPQNRMSGVTNFLANPEVQNALLQFGRAFSRDQPGEAGTILANAGEQVIGSNADQAALRAFESGGDIAAAAGRFANPDLVTQLQDRRQQQEQFEERLTLESRGLDLQETSIENDSIINTARLTLDEGLATARIQNMESQSRVAEQTADARQTWWEAQADALGQGGRTESLALRRNEFLGLLDEQQSLIDDEVDQIVHALEDIDISLTDTELRQLRSGDVSIDDLDLSSADISGIPFYRNAEEAEAQAGALTRELKDTLRRQRSIQLEKDNIINVQSRALSGLEAPQAEGDEGSDLPEEAQPQGTPESPVIVNSTTRLENLPVGSYVNFLGTQGRWNGSTIVEE